MQWLHSHDPRICGPRYSPSGPRAWWRMCCKERAEAADTISFLALFPPLVEALLLSSFQVYFSNFQPRAHALVLVASPISLTIIDHRATG